MENLNHGKNPTPEEKKKGCLMVIDRMRAKVESGEFNQVLIFCQDAEKEDKYVEGFYGKNSTRKEIIGCQFVKMVDNL